MVLLIARDDGDWTVADYKTTWKYGYDFVLDAAQELIDADFIGKVEKVSVSNYEGTDAVDYIEEVKKKAGYLRRCRELRTPHEVLTIAGISQILKCPIQVSLFTDKNILRLYCPKEEFEKEGAERDFNEYFNSLEIHAYCTDAVRKAKSKKNK